MKAETLSAKQIEHMKPDPTGRIEVAAGPPKGLYLVVQSSGAKSWAFRYRWLGKTRKLTFDTYPKMSLAAARAEAESAVKDLENNIDPARTRANEEAAAEREEQTEAMAQESVGRVAEEFFKRGLTPKEKDRGEAERIIRREVISKWKHRGIADIKPPEVIELLDCIVDRGTSVMACRVRGVMQRFFKWSEGRKYITESPMRGVPKPGPDSVERDHVIEPAELAEIWSAVESFGYPLCPFIRMLVLTAQRRGEVATMRWRDIDLEKAVWTMPAAVAKNGREHKVPLSSEAVAILTTAPRFKKGDYVWTTCSGEKSVNGFSKLKARIDKATLARRTEAGIEENIPGWTMHDIRRSATTVMAQSVPAVVLAAILNHSRRSVQGITAVYDRYKYTDEKRAALESWCQFVLSLQEKKAERQTA